MNVSMEGLDSVVRTFGYEWSAHSEGRFEDDTLYGRTQDEAWEYFLKGLMVNSTQVDGATVLDVGCGPGFYTRSIAEHAAGLVIGVDVNEAVDVASANCRGLDNVQFVQANLFKLPFPSDFADLTWCAGVLHHTPDPAAGHRSLARCTKPGGVLFVWVYAKRLDPFRLTRDLLKMLQVTKLAPRHLMRVAKGLSYASLALLRTHQSIRGLSGLRPRTARAARTAKRRTFREMYLRWFDTLSPEYASRHTEEEVIGWFYSENCDEVHAIDEPKVGVRGVAAEG